MAERLFTTLVTDGPRDQLLAAPIAWLLEKLSGNRFEPPRWADPRVTRTTHKDGLERRLVAALALYGCDLLFVHRDAENTAWNERRDQIHQILVSLAPPIPAVCVVPVRMSEAWFLFDTKAIRRAAGNPAGAMPLDLPPLRQIEVLKDPKDALKTALRSASGLSGRRLAGFQHEAAVYRLPNFIPDYTPLRELPAFAALEEELREVLAGRGWLKDSDS